MGSVDGLCIVDGTGEVVGTWDVVAARIGGAVEAVWPGVVTGAAAGACQPDCGCATGVPGGNGARLA